MLVVSIHPLLHRRVPMFLVYEDLMRRAKVQSPENPVARENRAH